MTFLSTPYMQSGSESLNGCFTLIYKLPNPFAPLMRWYKEVTNLATGEIMYKNIFIKLYSYLSFQTCAVPFQPV